MNKTVSAPSKPKSIRQKRVLEFAEKNPNASLAKIAENVATVTTDDVDRILTQFGDPATDNGGEASSPPLAKSESGTDSDLNVVSDETSDKKMSSNNPPIAASMNPDTNPESNNGINQTKEESSDSNSESISGISGNKEDLSEEEKPPEPEDLTQKERETLRAVYYEPTAAQKEVADMLGVSRATVSNRVNSIPGFNWQDRESFVEEIFDEERLVDGSVNSSGNRGFSNENTNIGKHESATASVNPPGNLNESVNAKSGKSNEKHSFISNQLSESSAQSEVDLINDIQILSNKIEEMSRRLETVEDQMKNADTTGESSLLDDSELFHKIVYACINSERVSEDEELKILELFIE